MNTVIGLGGARRNTAVAIVRGGDVVMAAEQERLTRARGAAFSAAETTEFIQEMLRLSGLDGSEVTSYAFGEDGFAGPASAPHVRLAHAHAHACASFLMSGFASAAILVCDSASDPQLTVWRGDGREVRRAEWPWTGDGFARVFSRATAAIGFVPQREEHRFETLARAGGKSLEDLGDLIVYRGDHLQIAAEFESWIAAKARDARARGVNALACLAHDIQAHISDQLLAVVCDIKRVVAAEQLCLAGGLFFNTALNTAIASRGAFANCFVPPNPGNPGLAIGAALAADEGVAASPARAPGAYLGPQYEDADIKRLFDNCKLTYDYVDDGRLVGTVADALARGLLVAWFQGRMEWGPRALGNRSIFANPLSPHVLSNLNTYLKQSHDYRTYGVMVREADASTLLKAPRPSHFMEFEAEFHEPQHFKSLLPYSASRVRYQTVPSTERRLSRLLEAVGERTGCPLVINTSFNGFHEPIACSPRDAVRVFYGTGLDLLAIGNFIVRK